MENPAMKRCRTRQKSERLLFEEPESNGVEPLDQEYQPLASVWFGTDAELLEQMLAFYPRKRPELILDATVNGGRFWEGSKRKVLGMDIDARHCPDVVADNRHMPFPDACFDVVVYDPPHVPNQGKDQSKDFKNRFGLVLKSSAKTGYNFSHLYPPFVAEAYRVLKPEGLLLCKIADYVHGHRFQWAHLELLKAAVAVGFCACDCIVKVRKGPIRSPRWQKAHHARRHHCYWLVFRKSNKCE
jgi:SAM-dependent methyltransferase